MPRKATTLLHDLSLDDLKRMLAVKEKVVVLEKRKAELEKELAKIDAELKKALAGEGKVGGGPTTRRKARRKKPVRKAAPKAAKRSARRVAGKATKKVAKKAKKKAAKKVAKKAVRRTAGGQAKRAARPAARSGGRPTLEDVIVKLIQGQGDTMTFQDMLGAIQKRKLFKTKSANFANVLRRTLSTSDKVKRVARGVYAVA